MSAMFPTKAWLSRKANSLLWFSDLERRQSTRRNSLGFCPHHPRLAINYSRHTWVYHPEHVGFLTNCELFPLRQLTWLWVRFNGFYLNSLIISTGKLCSFQVLKENEEDKMIKKKVTNSILERSDKSKFYSGGNKM